MMRRLLLAAICSAAVLGSAQAQSTAQPVVPGYISTVGCPGAQKSCFLPFSPSNPLPVSGGGSGGGGTVTQGQAGSSPWLTTIYQGGNALSATNPIFTQVTNFPATQPVSGTVTASQGSAPWSFNLTQLAGTALGAPSAYGTAPTGNVAGVNAFVTGGQLSLYNAQTAPGTSATSAVGVQGSANGVPLPVSGTVTANATTGATMTTSQPTVGTTVTGPLVFSGTAHRELVNPPGNSTIYIGGSSGVTTTTGYPILPGTSYDVTRFTGSVYAIGTASQTIGLISY